MELTWEWCDTCALESRLETSDLRVWSSDELLVVFHTQVPTLSTVQDLANVARRHFVKQERLLGVVIVIDALVGPPDPTTRAALGRLISRQELHIGGLARVVRGEGFAAATARAVITGLTLVTRPDYPTKIFASMGEAAAWLESTRVISPSARQSLSLVDAQLPDAPRTRSVAPPRAS